MQLMALDGLISGPCLCSNIFLRHRLACLLSEDLYNEQVPSGFLLRTTTIKMSGACRQKYKGTGQAEIRAMKSSFDLIDADGRSAQSERVVFPHMQAAAQEVAQMCLCVCVFVCPCVCFVCVCVSVCLSV